MVSLGRPQGHAVDNGAPSLPDRAITAIAPYYIAFRRFVNRHFGMIGICALAGQAITAIAPYYIAFRMFVNRYFVMIDICALAGQAIFIGMMHDDDQLWYIPKASGHHSRAHRKTELGTNGYSVVMIAMEETPWRKILHLLSASLFWSLTIQPLSYLIFGRYGLLVMSIYLVFGMMMGTLFEYGPIIYNLMAAVFGDLHGIFTAIGTAISGVYDVNLIAKGIGTTCFNLYDLALPVLLIIFLIVLTSACLLVCTTIICFFGLYWFDYWHCNQLSWSCKRNKKEVADRSNQEVPRILFQESGAEMNDIREMKWREHAKNELRRIRRASDRDTQKYLYQRSRYLRLGEQVYELEGA